MPAAWTPDREQLAWAAGFFDGEGNVPFAVYRNGQGKATRGITLQVAQCHPQPLERFQAAVAGLGALRGPYPKPAPRQPVWQFTISGHPGVSAAVAMIFPFLGPVKQEQARTALCRYRDHPTRGWARRARPEDIDQDEVTRRLSEGESLTSIARDLGADRGTLSRHRDALAATLGRRG